MKIIKRFTPSRIVYRNLAKKKKKRNRIEKYSPNFNRGFAEKADRRTCFRVSESATIKIYLKAEVEKYCIPLK